jgi:hypothetical protein
VEKRSSAYFVRAVGVGSGMEKELDDAIVFQSCGFGKSVSLDVKAEDFQAGER